MFIVFFEFLKKNGWERERERKIMREIKENDETLTTHVLVSFDQTLHVLFEIRCLSVFNCIFEWKTFPRDTHIKSYHLWSWMHYRPICFVTYLSKCMKVRWIKICHVLMIECNSFKLPGLHSVKTLSLSLYLPPLSLSLFLCTYHISHSVSVCLSLAFIFSHLFFTPRSFNAFIFFTRVFITCNKIPGFEY